MVAAAWRWGAEGVECRAGNGHAVPAAEGTGCRPRLADRNMNEHVAFDSGYYISITVAGYDDPQAQAYVSSGGRVVNFGVPTCTAGMDGWTPLNYAFMPGHPMAMKGVMAVAGVVPGPSSLTDNGLATLSGIVVSALGGLLLVTIPLVTRSAANRPNSEDPLAGQHHCQEYPCPDGDDHHEEQLKAAH